MARSYAMESSRSGLDGSVQFAECMIMRLLKYSKGRILFHDLYDDQLNHRIECEILSSAKEG